VLFWCDERSLQICDRTGVGRYSIGIQNQAGAQPGSLGKDLQDYRPRWYLA